MGAIDGGYRGRVADIRDATPADLDAVFDLLAERSRAVFGVSEQERRFLEQDFGFPGSDRFVAADDGRIAGYARLDSTRDLVLAASDEQTADALLARVEARARERRFEQIECVAVPEDRALTSLVERSGFAHTRDILRMWRPLNGSVPEPAWPGGVVVRTYEPPDAESVHRLLDTTYRGWDADHVSRPLAEWIGFMTDHDEFDPSLWFLVERDGELVACALHWAVTNGRGWVKDIVVHEGERRRGLGKALLHHALRAYAERGAQALGLKVDSTNPTGALKLYERVGFDVDRRYGIWVKRL
jgi:ribosomal protein S18 acetylase RimI-like enzyme